MSSDAEGGGFPTADLHDLNTHRETKRIEKKIEAEVDHVRQIDFNGEFASMMAGGAFMRYAAHVERVMPPGSPLTVGPTSQIAGAIVQAFSTAMELEDAKLCFTLLLDWLHETHVAQYGRPPFPPPPVLCSDCEPPAS